MSLQNNERPLGLCQTTSLVTGNLVGSGVFLLPASLALFGHLTFIAWLLTGAGAIMLAWVFARLSLQSNSNGGPHNFVQKAYGANLAYWVAWAYWILSWISNAALIVAATSYISIFTGALTSIQMLSIELFILCSITIINLIGIRFAGRFEFVMTTLKLIPLIGIPLVGFFYIDWANLSFSLPEDISLGNGIASAMFLTIWGFIGLETATVTSGEISNPQKNIPRATIIGTSIALFVYLFGSFVMFAVLGTQKLINASAPYADLAGAIFNANWTGFIALAAIICCLGSFNGWTMVVGRIAEGAAQASLFPKIFAKRNANGTPTNSIIISAICTTPILFLSLGDGLLEQFNAIIDISITLILLVYGSCIFSYFRLNSGAKTLFEKFMLLGASCFVAFALFASGLKMFLLSLVLIALGLPMRLMMKRSNYFDSTPVLVKGLSSE